MINRSLMHCAVNEQNLTPSATPPPSALEDLVHLLLLEGLISVEHDSNRDA